MIFTNKHAIPLPIAVWLAHNTYVPDEDENAISATTILKSIRQIMLGRRHRDSTKIVDVMDMAASKIGSSIHAGVEEALKEDVFKKVCEESFGVTPKEFYSEIRTKRAVNGFNISGQFDIVYNGTVLDIKSTSTWKYILGDAKDFRLQLSIYKWLNPELVKNQNGWICYIFTDWSKQKALTDSEYPQQRIVMQEIVLMTDSEIEEYLSKKTQAINYLELVADDDLPECTPEERWAKPAVYKYYKNGASLARSTKNYDTTEEAYARVAKDGGVVVEHKGESTGCTYCSYSNLCNQYRKIQGEL